MVLRRFKGQIHSKLHCHCVDIQSWGYGNRKVTINGQCGTVIPMKGLSPTLKSCSVSNSYCVNGATGTMAYLERRTTDAYEYMHVNLTDNCINLF